MEAPQAVTQKGIADAIDIRVTHVPRSVRKLDEDGLIYESVMHIEGMDKRRKAYFLTEKGMFSANEIKRSLESRKVPYRDSQGSVQNILISEIPDLSGIKLDILDIIRLFDKEGILNQKSLEMLSEHSQGDQEEGDKTLFDFPHKAPDFKDFIGRKKETETLGSWMDDDRVVLISINGGQGIGKTTLLSKLLSEYHDRLNVFWFKFGKGDEFSQLRTFLSDFFSKLNRSEFKTAIRSKGNGMGDIVKGTIMSMTGSHCVLVFDSMDRADPDSLKFISLLTQDLRSVTGSKVVLLHEESPKKYIRTSLGPESFREMKLEGLDRASCKSLLGQKKLSKEEFERIFKLTEGNPLALKLIKSEDVKDLEKSGKYTPDELTLIKYLKSIDKI